MKRLRSEEGRIKKKRRNAADGEIVLGSHSLTVRPITSGEKN